MWKIILISAQLVSIALIWILPQGNQNRIIPTILLGGLTILYIGYAVVLKLGKFIDQLIKDHIEITTEGMASTKENGEDKTTASPAYSIVVNGHRQKFSFGTFAEADKHADMLRSINKLDDIRIIIKSSQ